MSVSAFSYLHLGRAEVRARKFQVPAWEAQMEQARAVPGSKEGRTRESWRRYGESSAGSTGCGPSNVTSGPHLSRRRRLVTLLQEPRRVAPPAGAVQPGLEAAEVA